MRKKKEHRPPYINSFYRENNMIVAKKKKEDISMQEKEGCTIRLEFYHFDEKEGVKGKSQH